MTIHSNFQPKYGSTQTASPGAGSATLTIGKGNKTLRVKNTGATNAAFFRTGLASDGTVTATAADMPVFPGEVVYIEKPQDHDTLAHISAAGTTITVTVGEGGMGSGS
jgi:subtilase family serine protease